MKGDSVFTIIPARGGSKRIPGKNLQLLGGKPLIVWSIEFALRNPEAGVPWVTTDDPAIAEVSEKAGARVILRPAELAGDLTPTVPVVLHALEVSGLDPALIVLLQPTSPFRSSALLADAMKLMGRMDADAVIAVSKAKMAPEWNLATEHGWLCAPEPSPSLQTRSQDQPLRYLINGSLYIYRTPWYTSGSSRPFPERTVPLLTEPPFDIDIDTPADFRLAQCVASSYDPNW